MSESLPGLTGRRVLIVEDEWLVASETGRLLAAAGAEVLGPTGTVDDAFQLLRSAGPVDAVLLDIDLRDEKAYGIADRLLADGATFIFLSGYPRAMLPRRFREAPFLDKPFDLRAATRLLAMADRPE